MRLMGASFKKIAEKLAAGSYAVGTKRQDFDAERAMGQGQFTPGFI